MSRRALWSLLGALALLGLLGVWLLSARGTSGPRVLVGGGDGGGMPRAQPAEEHFDAVALERVMRDPAADALQALVVVRNGYIVLERYGHGITGESVIDSGPFAEVLVALAAGVATQDASVQMPVMHGFDAQALRAAIEAGAKQRYEVYLSRSLWRRLNAAAAWIALPAPGAAAPADCCFHARVLDWMRVASLLVDDGRFEGKQVVPAGWVRRMQQPTDPRAVRGFGIELAPSANGAEPFAASGVFFLRGPSRWRLWLVPGLKLAVLFGAERPSAPAPGTAETWDETRIPNLVIRALSDRPVQPGDLSELQQLVPGH